MATVAQRPKELPRSPFYKSSTLKPYHLQAVKFDGSTIRDKSASERARNYIVRRSLTLKDRVAKKNEGSPPAVPAINPVYCGQTTTATTATSTEFPPRRLDSRQSLLKRTRTSSCPSTARSDHKHQKTVAISESPQLAAAEDPRLKFFDNPEVEPSVTSLALRNGESSRISMLFYQETSPTSENSIKRVAGKVKSTAQITATRLGKVIHRRRICRRLVGRLKSKSELEKKPTAFNGSYAPPPKSPGPSTPTAPSVSEVQERLYQPTQESCSAREMKILDMMLKRAFRHGHTDFSDLRPIGRLLARCTGALSFNVEKVYPSGCKELQGMYSGDGGREDDVATLISPVEAPAVIARPDAAATTAGATSWFVVGIKGPPLKGKPGLTSQIKLGIASEIIDHYPVAGEAPAFRVCCVSQKQVEDMERSLRQNERQLNTRSTEVEVNSPAKSGSAAAVARSTMKSGMTDFGKMYTER